MSVHEDLLNNGENNCSFTEDEVDIMCSKDGDDACGDGMSPLKEKPSLSVVRAVLEKMYLCFSGKNVCKLKKLRGVQK